MVKWMVVVQLLRRKQLYTGLNQIDKIEPVDKFQTQYPQKRQILFKDPWSTWRS